MDKPLKPPKGLLRPVGRAIADYGMIRDGDRVLLGLSGGKDSLSLLQILLHLQRHAPIRFEVGAITVDPQIPGFDPSLLKPYLEWLGVPYFYNSQPIAEEAEKYQEEKSFSFCAFCARMKRGTIYSTARREGYNVIALAQHLDDLAESFLMSAFHRGQLRTMKAHYVNDAGDLRIIRPLVYARERQTAAFAESAELPVIPDNCPACFAMPTEREHMKQLLLSEEQRYKHLFKNLLSAMRPLMTEETPTETPEEAAKTGDGAE
ncbi:tRNA 2-thiocytidine biosynthesis TtcA family protein [Thiohalomonas denitrificans]|uniref:tRNA 2-thiocytidine biosynthesis TtcA family protein n=1 Tax=Thiohalomonas denitrificans TaxID=415747 RepID=UPI0026E93ED3|nr:ATP-binding protein [Thiohalomonas denitrificans]